MFRKLLEQKGLKKDPETQLPFTAKELEFSRNQPVTSDLPSVGMVQSNVEHIGVNSKSLYAAAVHIVDKINNV